MVAPLREPLVIHKPIKAIFSNSLEESMTQGKIDLRNESGRPMKVKVVREVSEK